MSTIYIDDLTKPQISDAGMKVMAERAAIPIDFNIDAIIKAAEMASDVPLYRDDYIFDSFDRYIKESFTTGEVTKSGKGMMAQSFAGSIIQRSRMEALFKRHPEINDVEIKSPVVIAGLPRTGTTNLCNIMAADRRFNSLKFWEAWQPIPSLDQLEGKVPDNRVSAYEKGLSDWHKVAPYWQNMYDVPNDGAAEECILFHLEGLPVVNLNHVDTPEWRRWFWEDMDANRLYTFLRRNLQALHWLHGNDQRWVLKSPHHMPHLPVIDKIFDDAKFVFTHRDPTSSMISNATMMAYLFRECYEHPDTHAAALDSHDMINYMARGMVHDIDKLDPSNVHHVYFHNYMADTMGTLKSIYGSANMDWSKETEKAFLKYIEDHPRGRLGGRIVYDPEKDFNLTRAEIRARYSYYFDKFPETRVEDKHG